MTSLQAGRVAAETRRMILRRMGVIAVWWCALGLPLLRAHDPGISTAEVKVLRDRVEITTGFAPDDARVLLPAGQRNEDRWEEDNFPEVRPALQGVAPQLWEVTEGAARLGVRESSVQLLPGDNVSFLLVYPRRGDGGRLVLRAPRLGDLPAGHRQFVIVADEQGSTLTKKLMRADDATIEVVGSGAAAAGDGAGATGNAAGDSRAETEGDGAPTFWGFLKLGVEHIWMGYDHLLFLFALLVVCRTFRSIVTIVSCFTVAHSITLALATLEWVNLPARWVEPAIAASIVFVGVENLVRRGEEPRGRGVLTFGFGLIHGFGFASVLRDLGVGRGGSEGIAMPLFSFNLGVELGQIVIAAVVLPLVWRLRKREAFVRRGVPTLSALVVVAGLYWLLERTVFS